VVYIKTKHTVPEHLAKAIQHQFLIEKGGLGDINTDVLIYSKLINIIIFIDHATIFTL